MSRSKKMRVKVDAYLESLCRRNYSPATLALLRFALEKAISFFQSRGRRRWPEVTADDLDAYRRRLAGRRLTACTQEKYLRALRSFFAWLEKTGALFINPAVSLVLPRYTERLLPAPSEVDLETWLSLPDTTTARGIRDRAILEVLYSSGLRIGELLSMKIDTPDLDRRQLRVIGKGNQERVIPLGRHAVCWMEKYRAEARPVFAAYHRRLPSSKKRVADTALWLARYGGALTRKAVWMLFYRYAMRNHLPRLTPHSLRRACATHLLRHGAHPIEIQTLLGHADARSLSHYLRLTIADLKLTHAASNPGS